MKLLLICLCSFVYACTATRALGGVKSFEFGVNIGSIVFTTSGSIGRFEKVKKVPVLVPDCTVLQYVRVDVSNPLVSPIVKFHWDTNTVIIEYTPLEYSVSQYTIIAKAVKMYPCNAAGAKSGEPEPVAIIDHGA